MSLWRHEPPNPIPARRSCEPILASLPRAVWTSAMSAPVRSQRALVVLMLLTHCASIALGCQLCKFRGRAANSLHPLLIHPDAVDVCKGPNLPQDPSSSLVTQSATRSVSRKFLTASPSARDSGLDKTSKDKVGQILRIYLSHDSTLSTTTCG